MNLRIREAMEQDRKGIMRLLVQVNDIHAAGRPDLFIQGKTKYSEEELTSIIGNPQLPLFVALNKDDSLVGYCFCVINDYRGSNNLRPIKSLYIDDLCVDENCRGEHVGHQLFDFVRQYAKREGFYNITLNVWSCNPSAMTFYQSLGMVPLKVGMESIL